MLFEVKAQSDDQIIMTLEADDLFEAALIVGERMDCEVAVESGCSSTTFEDDRDYYDIRPVED